jgi:phosphate-selective porin OprO and OprP
LRSRPWKVLVLALTFAMLGVTLSAQGVFYREVAKDGRIYVFNNMEHYVAWDKSGEMGVAITLLGYGPAGETMVFDTEEAIHLYNFKHDRPGDPRPQPKVVPAATVTWKDGATTLLFPNAQVRVNNRVQLRFTNEMPDETVTLSGAEAPGNDRGSFRIRRFETKVDGWIYKQWIQYTAQFNWPNLNGSNPAALLEEAEINLDLSPEHDRKFQVKFGQFKVPFGTDELNSSMGLQFVDRPQVENAMARGRDAGLQVWGQLLTNRLEYRAGVFNGNGVTRTSNDNDKYQYDFRLSIQPNGFAPMGTNSGPLWSEPDFESTDKPIYALNLSYEKNDFWRTTTNVDLRDDVMAVDGQFKFKGFSARATQYWREREPEPANNVLGAKFNSNGWYAQAGYLLGAKRQWEVVGRYGDLDPTDAKDGDNQTEIRGGLNYYYNRHALKVQADFGQLKNKANGQKNAELRLQTQLQF